MFSYAFPPARPQSNLIGERRCFGRSNLVSLSRPQRNLIGERRCLGRSNLVSQLVSLEAQNKTLNCRTFYIFIISSAQLKSLGQTNLFVRRSQFERRKTECYLFTDKQKTPKKCCLHYFCFPCYLNGLVAINSRLTFTQIQKLTSSLLYVHGRIYLVLRTSTTYVPLFSPWIMYVLNSTQTNVTAEQRRLGLARLEGIIPGRADILTLSRVEAYKESRQKILVIKYGKHKFKIEMLQYLIDMAASITRLYSPNKLILILYEGLDSLRSRTHTTYIQSRFDRRFRRSNLARREIRPALPGSDIVLTLSLVEAYNKESRQMRLAVKFGQTNLLVRRREFLSSLSCLYMCVWPASTSSPNNVASK